MPNEQEESALDPMVFLQFPVGIKAVESTVPFLLNVLGEVEEDGSLEPIAYATGFRFNLDGEDYLITNWHVVTGKHAFTGDKLSLKTPKYLGVMIAQQVDTDGGFAFGACAWPLYADNGSPAWLEHPHLGSTCDVVALPFKMPRGAAKFMHPPANHISRAEIPVRPGSEVFAVGYIDGYGVHNGFPIWRSGYLASEPELDVVVGAEHPMEVPFGGSGFDLPAVFIDALTRHGMSGAPVFASFNGVWHADSGGSDYRHGKGQPVVTSGRKFLGCYSARVFREGDDALGLCWKASAIEEVCRGKTKGSGLWREPTRRPSVGDEI